MTDKERIDRLESEVRNLKSELEAVAVHLRQLTQSTTRTRQSVQAGFDGVVKDLKIIYGHVKMPGVTYNANNRIIID